MVSSRAIQDPSQNEYTNVTQHALSARGRAPPPPPPARYVEGKAFYYDGWPESASQITDFENLWGQLVDLLNLVGKIEVDDVFDRWYGDWGRPLVQSVFDRMKAQIKERDSASKSSKRDTDAPKIWISRNDYLQICSNRWVEAYLTTVSKLRGAGVKLSANSKKMGDNNCLIHFCKDQFDHNKNNQVTDCNKVKDQRMNNDLDGQVGTLLHELIHCPSIGDAAMDEYGQGPILIGHDEVYDAYECTQLKEKCDNVAPRNPQSYTFYTANRSWNKKCSFNLKDPFQVQAP
ncbi:hypothetical protein NUU61_008711 [Penicillium alfredii]|uniref:Lysine-specific metallo-endopeptidase domain-containing protein n=1 Tax=Penicillium alfredii TaxID=1506179 RepID=A0A9W9ELN0_9EURO|nr:uncharacterized protein NUU61_008711 [Penicillium alfredii]KAJ5084132.1 hypothetical protein NUU61_008711 [Penicillium alfredii]